MAAMTPIEQAVVRFTIWSQREIPDKTILAEALMQAEREVDPFHNPALRNKK